MTRITWATTSPRKRSRYEDS